MQCMNWNYQCNDIAGDELQSRQDAIVRFIFHDEPREWFKTFNKSTYMTFWDGSTKGYVSQRTMWQLSKKVNILGPIAAIFGRDLELEIATAEQFQTIPVSTIEQSIETHNGTLRKEHFEDRPPESSIWTGQSGQQLYWQPRS